MTEKFVSKKDLELVLKGQPQLWERMLGNRLVTRQEEGEDYPNKEVGACVPPTAGASSTVDVPWKAYNKCGR